MYLFIEKRMTGGISYIAKRHSKANNKYMQSCDVDKPSKFIMYLDAKKFIWLSNKSISSLWWI